MVYNTPTGYSEYTEKDYPLVTDADFYVSTAGNDSNDGSFDKPFETFERARDAVRDKKADATNEIKVAFMAGEYGNLNIDFTSEDSGTETVPITYCAYGDGEVTFCNGMNIPFEDFKPIDEDEKYLFIEASYDNIYKVSLAGKLDKFNSRNFLFNASSVCYEARYPNKKGALDNCFSDFTTTHDELSSIELQGPLPNIVSKFRTTEGMKVTGFLRTGWLIDTFPVKSYDSKNHILSFDFEAEGVFDNGYPLNVYPLAFEGRMTDTVFFHNLSDQLDYAGEYWFDEDTKNLYVFKPDGDYTITEKGTFISLSEDCNYISFIGLNFNGSNDTAIKCLGDHITIDQCKIGDIGGKYVIDANGVNNFSVTNNEMYKFIQSGVHLDSNTNVNELISGNNIIDNNYFHDFTLPQYFANCISLWDVGARVSHNVFRNGGHGAVDYGGIDNVIEYNVFDKMMQTTQDFGAVYTWNSVTYRSNKIRYNLFIDISDNNAFSIYMDDNTCGQEIYGNIFYNSGAPNIMLNGGRDNEIYNNVSISQRGAGLISSNERKYANEVDDDGNFTDFGPGNDFYDRFMNNKPKVDEPGYEIWKVRWPILYTYNTNMKNLGDPECLFTIINYVRNNVTIGSEVKLNEYNVNENNKSYTIDDNPIFVDPTNGDYSIREDSDFFKIPYDQIGRY